MTDQTDAPTDAPPEMRRRNLLRGAAVLAGAVGATVAGAGAQRAEAADGGNVIIGASNTASSKTSLSILGAGSDNATLALRNTKGAQLQLVVEPSVAIETPHTGEIKMYATGPDVAVDFGGGVTTIPLLTGFDVDYPQFFDQYRPLDTRRENPGFIPSSAPNAFDSQGRLKAGKYLDLAFDSAATTPNGYQALFLNVAAVKPLATGHIDVYAPGSENDPPITSNVNFSKNVTISNLVVTDLGIVGDWVVVRIATSATTHVIADFMGAFRREQPDAGPAQRAAVNQEVARRRARTLREAKRLQR